MEYTRQVVHEYCEYLSNDKKILFVENIGVRSLKAKDSLRLARAIKNFFKLKNLFYEIDENITYLGQYLFLFPIFKNNSFYKLYYN